MSEPVKEGVPRGFPASPAALASVSPRHPGPVLCANQTSRCLLPEPAHIRGAQHTLPDAGQTQRWAMNQTGPAPRLQGSRADSQPHKLTRCHAGQTCVLEGGDGGGRHGVRRNSASKGTEAWGFRAGESVVQRWGHSECWAEAKEDEEQGYRLAACAFGEEDGRVQENATGSICIKEIPQCSGLDPAIAFA